jgi:hypothetical protein
MGQRIPREGHRLRSFLGSRVFTRLTFASRYLIGFPSPTLSLIPLQHRQRGQMLLEGRTHPRTAERFLVQVSSVEDPRLTELASVENHSLNGVRVASERAWELGSHVDLKSLAGSLKARARVVYCRALGPRKFVVGLNIFDRNGEQAKPPTKE